MKMEKTAHFTFVTRERRHAVYKHSVTAADSVFSQDLSQKHHFQIQKGNMDLHHSLQSIFNTTECF